jgi:hypothetical protein
LGLCLWSLIPLSTIFQLYYWWRKPPTCRKSLISLSRNVVHITWAGFELTSLVVLGTDCIAMIGSYHTITTTTAPSFVWIQISTTLYLKWHRSQLIFIKYISGQDTIFLCWNDSGYLINLKLTWVRIPFMTRCTRYNFMWERLLVTSDRSVVFSGFLHQ